MTTNRSGIAIIFVLGVLAMLLVLGTAFVLGMSGANRMAEGLYAQLAAEQAALGGIELAAAQLKKELLAQATATAGQDWYHAGSISPSYQDGSNSYSGVLGDARYTLEITDVAAKININDASNPDLASILEGLPSMTAARAQAIVDVRATLPEAVFRRKSQVMLATGVGTATYQAIEPFITTAAYLDAYPNPNLRPSRAPVNINTAPQEVLSAVLRPVLTDKAEADNVANAIVSWRGGGNGYFDSWKKFNDFVEGLTLGSLTPAEKQDIKDNGNPNRALSQSTDFCFHSGGMFDIENTGEALDRAGNVVSTVTMRAGLHLHNILTITDREDFARSSRWYRVTWQDSCPVESTDDLDALSYASGYRKVPGALKVGFWDDFDEEEAYTQLMFKRVAGVPAAGFVLEDADGDGDKEFHHTNATPSDAEGLFGDFDIAHQPAGQTVDSWEWRSAYMRVWVMDEAAKIFDPNSGAEVPGHVRYRQFGGSHSEIYARHAGLRYVVNDQAKTGLTGKTVPAFIYENDPPGSDSWVGGAYPLDERFGNLFMSEVDGSPYIQPFHDGNMPDATPPGGLGIDSHGPPPHTIYKLRLAPGAVFEGISSSGPDGRNPPNYLFYYGFELEKVYRLFSLHKSDDTEGVRMEIIDPTKHELYPGSALTDGEINTWMNKWGQSGIKNFGSLPAWDDLRIICPFGDYYSEVLDGGVDQGQWGSIAWTATIPASADADTERATMDVRSSEASAMTGIAPWTFAMPADWHVGHPEPSYPVGEYVTAEGAALSATTAADQRFAQFRLYLGSTRSDTDAKFCRETPVLEDATLTYFPAARISVTGRGGS